MAAAGKRREGRTGTRKERMPSKPPTPKDGASDPSFRSNNAEITLSTVSTATTKKNMPYSHYDACLNVGTVRISVHLLVGFLGTVSDDILLELTSCD